MRLEKAAGILKSRGAAMVLGCILCDALSREEWRWVRRELNSSSLAQYLMNTNAHAVH